MASFQAGFFSLHPRIHATSSVLKLAADLSSSFAGIKVSNTPYRERKVGRNRAIVSARKVPSPDTTVLDSISRWIWRKIQPPCSGCVPDNHKAVDWLSWLPGPIHERLHDSEATAVPIVRETLIVTISYIIFKYTEPFCRQLNWIWSKYIQRDNEVTEEEFKDSGFHALVIPIQFFTLVLMLTRYIRVYFPLLEIPLRPNLVTDIRQVSFFGAVCWFLLGWKNRLFSDWKQKASRADKPRLVAIDRLSSLFIVTLMFFTGADILDVPIKSLAAFGGITGIAIGLASKEVVTNFFGGLVLWLTRPFVIGDKIRASQFSGYVQDIGFFQTQLLGLDKSHITVPNQCFTNLVITNLTRAKHRNLEASFELRTQDILKVDRITKKITALLEAHPLLDPGGEKPCCYVKSLNHLSVRVQISAATKAMSSADFYPIQQEIIVKAAEVILGEGAYLGMTAAFPATDSEMTEGGFELGVVGALDGV